jgi:hypothetical protein
VGSEGVTPSPHRVKAGHALLHLDPVLFALMASFSFQSHVSSPSRPDRLAISGRTFPVERLVALHARPLSGLLGIEIPRPKNDESRLGATGRLSGKNPRKYARYVTCSRLPRPGKPWTQSAAASRMRGSGGMEYVLVLMLSMMKQDAHVVK